MDNLEEVLQSLNEFDQAVGKTLSPELDQLLEHIAKTGRTVFPWPLLRPLIRFKLEKVLTDFFENGSPSNAYISDPTTKSQDFLPTVQKLINNLNCFAGTPFTIQRICELITEPRKHYKTTDKFLRGVEKNILVVSTVQPDGCLITRSVGERLTNGTMSPPSTESTIPINTTYSPPSSKQHPSFNSLLNTNFQENGAFPQSSELGEKKILMAEDCKVGANPEVVNPPQNVHSGESPTEQDSEKSPLPDQKHDTSEEKENSENAHETEENSKIPEENSKVPEENSKVAEENSKVAEENSNIPEENSNIPEETEENSKIPEESEENSEIAQGSDSLPENIPNSMKEPVAQVSEKHPELSEEKMADIEKQTQEASSVVENEEKPEVEPMANIEEKMDES